MEIVKMDFISKILPVLWQIIEKKKKCSINVNSLDEILTVNILFGRKKVVFSHPDSDYLLYQLKEYLAA
jgi:hypothetical protein